MASVCDSFFPSYDQDRPMYVRLIGWFKRNQPMGLVLKCTFRAKRSTKNRQIDFITVLNDHISGHTTFIVVNFWKN